MSESMNTLETKVKTVLLKEWDPLGVKDIPEAQDEYDAYVLGICRMLRAGQPNSEIFSHLRWIETERIGLDGDKRHTYWIAMKLLGLLA